MFIDQEVERFLQWLRGRGVSAATVAVRAYSLAVFRRFLEQSAVADLRGFGRAEARGYLHWLARQDYAPWSQATHFQALRALFEFLEANDAILVNPVAELIMPRLKPRLPRRVLSRSEAARLLALPDPANAVGCRDRAILELFYSTGLRLGEMVALRVADLDLKGGLVRVNLGKGGRDRVVPMGEAASAALAGYLDRVRSRWSQLATKASEALWLTSQPPYGPLRLVSVSRMVRLYGKRAGIPLSAHVWRHTCATHLVSAGANLAMVQQQLGHRNINTTQIYVRVGVPELKATLAAKHPRERGGSLCKKRPA